VLNSLRFAGVPVATGPIVPTNELGPVGVGGLDDLDDLDDDFDPCFDTCYEEEWWA
jgi:hypothetical protein